MGEWPTSTGMVLKTLIRQRIDKGQPTGVYMTHEAFEMQTPCQTPTPVFDSVDWAFQNNSLQVGWLPKDHPEFVRYEQEHFQVQAFTTDWVQYTIPVVSQEFATALLNEFHAMNWNSMLITYDVGLFNR